MKLTYYITSLIMAVFLAACSELQPLTLPGSTVPSVRLISVNGLELEAEITNPDNSEFEIVGQGFFWSEVEIKSQCCDVIISRPLELHLTECDPNLKFRRVVVENNSSAFKFSDSIPGLNLDILYFIKAYIEVRQIPDGNETRIICSPLINANTGNLTIIGSFEFLQSDQGITSVRLKASVGGLRDGDLAYDHGFMWIESNKNLDLGELALMDPLNIMTDSLSLKLLIEENSSFEVPANFSQGVFYYVIPYVQKEKDGPYIFDGDSENGYNYREVFIGDFWEVRDNNKRSLDDNKYPGYLFHGVAFNIGDLAYIGTGLKMDFSMRRIEVNQAFWSYDPVTDTYVPIGDFAGGGRFGAVAFTLNGKAYVGTGLKYEENEFLFDLDFSQGYPNPWPIIYEDFFDEYYDERHSKDFYEFNPIDNSWRKVADFPIPVRDATSFVIEGKAYVGTGYSCVNITDTTRSCSFVNEFYEFTPPVNGMGLGSWKPVQNIPTVGRFGSIGFALDEKGYIGTGARNTGFSSRTFYKFNGSWEQNDDFEVGTSRYYAMSFVIGGHAFIAGGAEQVLSYFPTKIDTWLFNPDAKKWVSKAQLPDTELILGMSFSIGGKGYIYGGNSVSGGGLYFSNDMLIYTPDQYIFNEGIE